MAVAHTASLVFTLSRVPCPISPGDRCTHRLLMPGTLTICWTVASQEELLVGSEIISQPTLLKGKEVKSTLLARAMLRVRNFLLFYS